MDSLVVRRWWLVPAAVLLGAAVGAVVSLVASTSRRAEDAVLVSSPRGPAVVTPMLPNVEELATSSVLAGNVRSTLRLRESAEGVRHRLHASIRPHTQVIVIAATDAHADRARQLADEAAGVFVRLLEARFGTASPALHASRIDQAHVLSGPNRHVVRNPLIGAGVGLVLGAAAAVLLGGGIGLSRDEATAAARRELHRREQLLDTRIKAVTARERELARDAGRLALRERELEQRAARQPVPTEPAPQPPPAPPPEPAAEPQPAVQPPPPTAPQPEPVPVPSVAAATGSLRSIDGLERLVAARRDAPPDKIEEWQTYLFFLREHAAIDGSLPAQFDALVDEVFGELLGQP